MIDSYLSIPTPIIPLRESFGRCSRLLGIRHVIRWGLIVTQTKINYSNEDTTIKIMDHCTRLVWTWECVMCCQVVRNWSVWGATFYSVLQFIVNCTEIWVLMSYWISSALSWACHHVMSISDGAWTLNSLHANVMVPTEVHTMVKSHSIRTCRAQEWMSSKRSYKSGWSKKRVFTMFHMSFKKKRISHMWSLTIYSAYPHS